MRSLLLIVFLLIIYNTSKTNAQEKDLKEALKTEIDEQNVSFYLYTRANREDPQKLKIGDTKAIETSMYNASKPTKFMTHGWQNTYYGKNCITVRRAFLDHDDYNVIVVDYGKIANQTYAVSVSEIKIVSRQIARMINFLVNQGSDPNSMSLVGHSLGAHVMGLAGYLSVEHKVGHVVGLDPAGPIFDTKGPGERISTSDATLVEIIHTDKFLFGIKEPVGHLDFYPNGFAQPGCQSNNLTDYCAHDRAYLYYAESLTRPDMLLAIKCPDYDAFLQGACGEQVPISIPRWSNKGRTNIPHGVYYLRTADKAPFGLGLEGVKPVGTI